MTENWQEGGFGLYVHWPFCEAKCPYCDFNSHVVRHVDQDRWARALANEIRKSAEQTPDRVLSSIFFGGGTPSLMMPDTVATVLGAAKDGWVWSNNIEISLEANPRSVEIERFRGFADAGVNRVSLGVQALNAQDLRRLGRLHDVQDARNAFDIARSVFERVSFDLIYARQDQSLKDWETELTEALSMSVDHLSLYQLTIEQGTAFWDRAKSGGLKGLPDEDLGADMYDLTQEVCDAFGYHAYEVSNHARPGAESRHNRIYWSYGDWIGVGPGAHGRFTLNGNRRGFEHFSAPGKWLETVEKGGSPGRGISLSTTDTVGEYLMMGLRVTEGIDIDRFAKMGGHLDQSIVDELTDLGLLSSHDSRLAATRQGRLVLNSVVEKLLP